MSSPPFSRAAVAWRIWAYLLLARGGFWRAAERDAPVRAEAAGQQRAGRDVAVIPARDEADVIAQRIASLLRQDYPGRFRVVLVDDQSSDGTAATARAAAAALVRLGG